MKRDYTKLIAWLTIGVTTLTIWGTVLHLICG